MSERGRALRRAIGFLGSFSMGYADVGADIFVAIGLVAAYAAGFSPFAFLIASVCYVTTGLAYAELTTAYPYAGGAQVFSLKAFNDLVGSLAGWALMLDYVLDIALFSIAAAGYLSFILPQLREHVVVSVAGFEVAVPMVGLAAFAIVLFLIAVNVIGIKESSALNVALVSFGLGVQALIIVSGFLAAFSLATLIEQFKVFGSPKVFSNVFYLPGLTVETQNAIYGITLAMTSFIGIESIAQAAEETSRPHKVLPRAFKTSIAVVVALTLLFSVLGLGSLGWEKLAEHAYNPIAAIAERVPVIGGALSWLVALTAFAVCVVSTNTGVIGVSRVMYSMGKLKLAPRWFSAVHPTRMTPVRTIVVFGLMGGALALTGSLYEVAGLYNFGALLSYTLVNLAHIRLRRVDKDIYRPWKTPLNIKLRDVTVSVVPILGFLSSFTLWALVVVYHVWGRVLGAAWVIAGAALYAVYRRSAGLPVVASVASKLVEPFIPTTSAIVVLPKAYKASSVAGAIARALGRNYRLTLLSAVDPAVVAPADAPRVLRDVEKDAEELCAILRGEGFECGTLVTVERWEQAIKKAVREVDADVVVVVRPAVPRIKEAVVKNSFYEALTDMGVTVNIVKV